MTTWFAIAGGLAAWTLQLLASYTLIDFACARAVTAAGAAPPAAAAPASGELVAPLLAVSAIAALIAAAATAVAVRRARSTRGAQRALYVAGALLDALSLVTIAFGAALPLLFAPCLRS